MTTPQPPFDMNSYPGEHPSTPLPASADNGEPKKKKKGGCMKWGAGIVGAIVLISVFTNLGGGDDEEATTASDSSEVAAIAADVDTNNSINPTLGANKPVIEEVDVESPEENIPTEYRSALREADSYANRMDMSKQGVYDQLTSEYGGQFSAEAAQYAIDNVEADWMGNAVKSAHTYQDMMSMSPSAIRDQLVSSYGEKFTAEEADYAMANLNAGEGSQGGSASGVPTEFTSALKSAENYSDMMHMSKLGLYDQLTSDYGEQFTAEAAQYAIENIQADWNANALASALNYQDSMNMSPNAIWDQLTSAYGGQFTAAEADYAIANL